MYKSFDQIDRVLIYALLAKGGSPWDPWLLTCPTWRVSRWSEPIRRAAADPLRGLSLIHISEPTRLALI
eukprot:9448191-Alexandrium_andersonii.AAC.1